MKTSSLTDSTTLFEVKPKCFVSIQQLKDWLPTVESALWFAKVYKMDYRKSGDLLRLVHKSDVLDALTSERPYKHDWSNEEAFAYLEEHSGTLFDPSCVKVLLANRARVMDIQQARLAPPGLGL